MNLNALATLAAILEHGSFAAAAARVGCTPSAVSLQVRQLEAYFGRPLFDRSGRGVRPTEFAVEAGRGATEVLGRLDALRAHRSMRVAGRVRLGAIATIQADPLPQVLRRLRDLHPALEIVVTLADSDQLEADLKAGRIDVAALVRPAAGGSTRLVWHDLARQPFVMLAPADGSGDSPPALLRRHGWIRYDAGLTGGRIASRHVRRLCPDVRCVMEVRSIDAIVAMVAAGLGVSVVPRPRAALLGAYPVRVVRLGRDGPSRRIALVQRGADVDDRNIDAVRRAMSGAYAAQITPP